VYIRRYGEFPGFYVPDEGEIVLAARSPAGPFLRAVVTSVRRASGGTVRVDVTWLQSSPVSASGTGIQEGTKGNMYVHVDDAVPLVRRTPASRS
jgi:hypothetical protein